MADRWRFKSDGRVKKSKPVKSGPERINTGLFNTLDNSIMKDILYFLNVKERHTVGECTDGSLYSLILVYKVFTYSLNNNNLK